MAAKKITVFTPSIIAKMQKDAEQRLERMDKHSGKKPSKRNEMYAKRIASTLIIMWKTDDIFAEMAKEAGKK